MSGFDDAGNPVIAAFDNRLKRIGWTLGAGLESASDRQLDWQARVPAHGFRLDPTVVPNGTVSSQFNSSITDDVVRVGINYKFGQFGAIIAKN